MVKSGLISGHRMAQSVTHWIEVKANGKKGGLDPIQGACLCLGAV